MGREDVDETEPLLRQATQPQERIRSSHHKRPSIAPAPENDEIGIVSVQGFQSSRIRSFFFSLFSIVSCGIIPLLFRWFPVFGLRMRCKHCHLSVSDRVLIMGTDGEYTVERVRSTVLCSEDPSDQSSMRYKAASTNVKYRMIEYKHVKYFYDRTGNTFNRPQYELEHSYQYIHDVLADGISEEVHGDRILLFGPNVIDIPVKSYFTLLLEEVLNPFYVFQAYSIILWCVEDYTIYAACIFFMSVISAVTTLVETRRNLVNLRDMAIHECEVHVLRGHTWKSCSSSELVPGDVVEVTDKLLCPCDMLLLNGSVIVNESMLTGESVPIVKAALPFSEQLADSFSVEHDKKYVLFSGTKVIQARYYGHSKVVALVFRTGFHTAKGSMMRSILFPKPSKFKFYEDAFRFVGILTFIALVGFGVSVRVLMMWGVDWYDILLRGLDLITIIVPPALPAAMTIGTAFAISRLKQANIFCISPPRVNVSGKIKLICFDKTGTLTEDGLDVFGVRPVEIPTSICNGNGNASASEEKPRPTRFLPLLEDISQVSPPLLHILAACHSITEVQGELVGDPLDLIMFNAVQWVLEEPQDGAKFDSIVPTIVRPRSQKPMDPIAFIEHPEIEQPVELGIIRRFEFSSKLQRMSVIVRDIRSDGLQIFVKGSPEVMRELSDPSSIPDNFDQVLSTYTREGYRVLGCGMRSAPELNWVQAQRVARAKVESNLQFMGLLIMQNKLKSATSPAITRLNRANIRSLMVTGDHALTAISVARKCHLLHPRRHVFLGDLVESPDTAPRVQWTDIDHHMPDMEPPEPPPPPYADGNTTPTSRIDTPSARSPSLLPSVVRSPFLLPMDQYELAITGSAFRFLRTADPSDFDKLLVKGQIFARMSPDDKRILVETLADMQYTVAMCGDGANDCGALKAAQVGISLSEAEASIAAPFTSKVPNVECVIKLIREGRAALVTSFQCFKYMALYSMIQFIAVIRLYQINSNLGDWQYLFIDLVLIVPLAVFMGRTGAYKEIAAKRRPPGSLIAAAMLMSLFGEIAIQAFFVGVTNSLLERQPWFVPLDPDPDSDNIVCFENTATFLISNFQYVTVALAFSGGPPFRKPLYTNWMYTLCIILCYAFLSYLVLYPSQWLVNILQLVDLPRDFRFLLLVIASANIVASWVFEVFIENVVTPVIKWFRRAVLRPQRRRYRQILMDIDKESRKHLKTLGPVCC
mmetsp:Transcript_20060/g.33425  ORF Transcript_20060/g.33425 Transcript_20060/m.33425 type:complete len:1211 (-) Transcript_20060:355-3987(-)